MFRVYDNKNHRFANGEFCLSTKDDLFEITSTIFGKDKLKLLPDALYTIQHYTGINDRFGNMIYEGDICRHVEYTDIVGVVAYSSEHACFHLFSKEASSYYYLNSFNNNEIEVVGNVFDHQELLV